ncbi:hypothetical protein [Geothermobacter hydrogeniphilus]|uniref:C-type cytochrome biogenesis protein CcmI n=1 Tax=Geothermobacter hydrogeniphilus TaxID=1969733 RepID=A0A1X0Y5W9_9BACT|nr:hypothetical protein [Geothermobacter hydrogeniphilus]ORJ60591.1 hypothetical protein B5V00_07070 [Geothermobacter hydrogeniphilus]
MEIATLLLISLLLMVYTLLPVFRPAAPLVLEQNPLERRRQALEQEKKTNLQAIRDIDFELATGKISAEDHEELRTLYSLRAADAIAARKRLREDHD